MKRSPRWYFSLRSPYSWLAYRDLLDRHADVAANLTWLPFFEPDARSERMLTEAGGAFVYTPMSRIKQFYVLQDMRRLATERGLQFRWPVDREPCWEVPHLAYLVAVRYGRGPDFVAAASRARWEQGRDICDRSTIADLARDLGLDPAELAGAADDPAMRAEGVQALLAVQRDGVFGVPFFINGFDKYWGIDRLAAFVATVTADRPAPGGLAGTAAAVSLVDTSRATDDGHAGGCG